MTDMAGREDRVHQKWQLPRSWMQCRAPVPDFNPRHLPFCSLDCEAHWKLERRRSGR